MSNYPDLSEYISASHKQFYPEHSWSKQLPRTSNTILMVSTGHNTNGYDQIHNDVGNTILRHRTLQNRNVNFRQAPVPFVCVAVLQPCQPNGVMSSMVSLPTTLLLGRLSPLSS